MCQQTIVLRNCWRQVCIDSWDGCRDGPVFVCYRPNVSIRTADDGWEKTSEQLANIICILHQMLSVHPLNSNIV